MSSIKPRTKGEKYRPTVEVLKEKNGDPTKVYFNGRVYAWVPEKYINGNKNKVGRNSTKKQTKQGGKQ